jgi:hypothetical protein
LCAALYLHWPDAPVFKSNTAALPIPNDRSRRILVIAGHPGEGPLTEPRRMPSAAGTAPSLQPVLVEFRGPRVRLLRVFRVSRFFR